MLHKLKENLPTIEILLGYFLYIFFIVEFSISVAIIWMIFVIYFWLFTTKMLQKYNFQSFINIICISGIIISITLFFTLGVEEVPYPEGALVFHVSGIAQSLLLFFISSTPLLLLNKKPTNKKRQQKTTEKTTSYDSDLWEEATIEDVNSGKFETV